MILNYVTDYPSKDGAYATLKVIKEETFGWKKPFYIVMDGSLIACKIIKVKYNLRNRNCFLHVKMADGREFQAELVNLKTTDYLIIGDCCFNNDNNVKSGHYDFYDSVDSYKVGNACKFYIEFISLEDVLVELLGCHCFTKEKVGDGIDGFYRYYWDGTKAISTPLMLEGLAYDNVNGFTADRLDCESEVSFSLTFPTKEICERENEVRVIEFADDEEVKENKFRIKTDVETSEADYNDIMNALEKFSDFIEEEFGGCVNFIVEKIF